MRVGKNARRRWVVGTALLSLALGGAVPLLAQAPTSLLPPGFGDDHDKGQVAPSPKAPASPQSPPANSSSSGQAPSAKPALQLDLSGVTGGDETSVEDIAEASNAVALSPAELAAQQSQYDLPPRARRSLSKVGPLTSATGGVAANAFGDTSGQFLIALMRDSKAPIVSRWASILLRRVLLSATDTPRDVNGADWTAERAWMLVRMGEANAARMLVQSVDSDQYSKRLYSVAMQAYLASADPTGLCPLYQRALSKSDSPSWQMSEAICAAFSAEQGRASAILNQAQRKGNVRGIDYRLTEKVVGAGVNSRRSVKIEWDGVDNLTAWRYGLATAVNVDIPADLMQQAGPQVQAWQASAPALALNKKISSVEAAARLGVFSGAALVDFYSQLDDSDNLAEDMQQRIDYLRQAYGAPSPDNRIDAMRSFWGEQGSHNLVAMLALSKAAAALPVAAVGGSDLSNMIAAMLSAGYDISALRWAQASDALSEDDGRAGWAMLAVGTPRIVIDATPDAVQSYISQDEGRGQMLFAGLAGLGRISAQAASSMAGDAGVSLTPRSKWERAIDDAGRRGEKGTVALLAAVGMQVSDWKRMPAEHVYHIVAALHRVGLNPEARMIAAEAIMRS